MQIQLKKSIAVRKEDLEGFDKETKKDGKVFKAVNDKITFKKDYILR